MVLTSKSLKADLVLFPGPLENGREEGLNRLREAGCYTFSASKHSVLTRVPENIRPDFLSLKPYRFVNKKAPEIFRGFSSE